MFHAVQVVLNGEEYAVDSLAVNGVALVADGYPRTKELMKREDLALTELGVSEFRK